MERMPPGQAKETQSDFISELRSIIEEADCDPGIVRKVLSGRSLPSNLEDAKFIRGVIWPALLGVRKRDVGDIEQTKCDLMEATFKELNIPVESISVAVLFCQSRGIDLNEPVGPWVHLLRPIRSRDRIWLYIPFISF